MSPVQCKGCEYKPSTYDTLEGYCMTCAAGIIKKHFAHPTPETTEWTGDVRGFLENTAKTDSITLERSYLFKACDIVDILTADLKAAQGLCDVFNELGEVCQETELSGVAQAVMDVFAELQTGRKAAQERVGELEKEKADAQNNIGFLKLTGD